MFVRKLGGRAAMAAAAKTEVRFVFFFSLMEIGENEKSFFLADANGADAAERGFPPSSLQFTVRIVIPL